MATKFCYKCKTEKDVSEFNRDTTKKDGCSSFCKECQKQYRKDNRIKISKRQKKYFKNNKAKNREYSKRDYKKNREKKLIYQKQYNKNNKETIKVRSKKYRNENKLAIQKRDKEYCRNNKEAVKKRKQIYGSLPETKLRRRKRHKEKQACDPMYKLNRNISGGICTSLKGNKRGWHWEDLVGYTLDKLKKHLEKQFAEGMSWDNYGKGGWVVDHITPRTVFHFTEPSHRDFKRCWALKNLQPLWEYDNLVKHSKLKYHFQPSLLL